LLDLMMPHLRGLDVLAAVRANPKHATLPCIILTAAGQEQQHTRAMALGATDFLTKPFHTMELVTKIRSLLRLRKLQSHLDHSEDVILTLAIAIEAKDPYTKGHSERVGSLSMELGGFLGMSEDDRDSLFKAGVLHDIGKLGIEDRVLHKAEDLTDQEPKLVKDHVLIGETICMPLSSARHILPVIRNHHERWDGQGFPDRLKGKDIPLFARIVAITDSFDAMVSLRPYRSPFTIDEAVGRMKAEKFLGQWDPDILEGFIEMMKNQRGFII
ncbi:MAG: HD domain-containing protein, partial [Nitrospiraceae bacterium]|nr:HD domain-containing protein [Nitrospiraceae bacterium]